MRVIWGREGERRQGIIIVYHEFYYRPHSGTNTSTHTLHDMRRVLSGVFFN